MIKNDDFDSRLKAILHAFNLELADLDKPLSELQLDSLNKVELAFLIEDEFNVAIDDSLIYEQSGKTIRELAGLINDK